MNQFEYKKRYDPVLGMYVKKHVHSGEIHGGALTDIFKSVANNIFGDTIEEAAKTASKKALQIAATKAGDYIGKKAGDKIIQLLENKNKKKREVSEIMRFKIPKKIDIKDLTEEENKKIRRQLRGATQDEIDERVKRLINGGRLRNYVI